MIHLNYELDTNKDTSFFCFSIMLSVLEIILFPFEKISLWCIGENSLTAVPLDLTTTLYVHEGNDIEKKVLT